MSVKHQLHVLFLREHRQVPNATALANAITSLEAIGHDSDAPTPLALRVGEHEGAVVLDLGDETGQVVIVDERGWQVAARSPVLFRRTQLTGPLPTPAAGGDLDMLRSLFNVTDGAWPRLLGWVVAAFFVDMPHPIAFVTGEQGTGKSELARTVVQLTDPSPVPLRTPPRNIKDWATAVPATWVVAIDNVSTISDWWSDGMARTVTGDGIVDRKLYTDNDVAFHSFRRALILTSIDPGALRGDLAERLLPIELERITPQRRREEAELRAAFRRNEPLILGVLLDLVSRVLRERPHVDLPSKPRMADFGVMLAALDRVMPSLGALSSYLASQDALAADVLDGDALAHALTSWWPSRSLSAGGFDGTVGELMIQLEPFRPIDGGARWPATASALSGQIKRLAPALAAQGIEVTFPPRSGQRRRIVLTSTLPTGASPDGHSIGNLTPVD